jgi:3-oxoadipate enol-lactonase
MTTTTTNGIEINYRRDGAGDELVVLVNGLADDLVTYDLQVPALVEAGYEVLRYDNRGVGHSAKPAGPYTTGLLAEDLHGLVDALGVERFHLVGVSMGGMIAQEYALAHPERLSSVTLACTYAAPGPFCGRMFALWERLARFTGLSVVMADVALWAFTPAFFAERPDEAGEMDVALSMIDQPVHAYLAQLSAIQTHDTTGRIGALAVPTLVLAGEQDILIPVSLSRQLLDLVPNAQWATTRGGHACLWEHPDDFNTALLRFLDQHRKAPAP